MGLDIRCYAVDRLPGGAAARIEEDTEAECIEVYASREFTLDQLCEAAGSLLTSWWDEFHHDQTLAG